MAKAKLFLMALDFTLKNTCNMLHKNHISKVEIYTDEWFKIRLGRFTSSRIHCLCGDEPYTKGAMTYIYHKIGELVTGQTTAEDEVIEDENTAWGNQYEPEAIKKFGLKMGLEYLAVQKLILNEERNFSSTPDAIWVKGICKNQEEYNVRTVEVKCPRKYHKFIPYYMCKNPHEVKKLNPVYFWQVIDQMDNCGSAYGYLAFYHPLFPPERNMNIVEFDKMKLWDEFKLLKTRKTLAVEKFNELKQLFINH